MKKTWEHPKSKRVDITRNVTRQLILDFIRKKNGVSFIYDECAEYTGLHYNTVCRMMKRLLAENAVRITSPKTYEVIDN